MKSKYKWKAVYNDSAELSEAKDVGYHHIDRSKLRFFLLLDRETEDVKFRVEINDGQRLIWRRRYAIHSNGMQEIAHLVGKQITISNKNYQWIALIFEDDGRIEFFDKYDKDNPFLNEIELFEYEQ